MKAEFLFLSGPTCLVSSLNYSPVDHLPKHQLLSAIELLDPALLGESLYSFQNGAWPDRTMKTQKDLQLVKHTCLFWGAQE